MKYILIFFATIQTTAIISQIKTFTLSDTSLIVGQEYTTRHIYFDLGKATLKPESNSVLDSIVSFLNLNQHVKLEVQVHSDSRVNPNCCDKPTENRARSIEGYLIKHNISQERLIAKGWGEKKPLVRDEEINKAKTKEDKEALHALNRRVVLKIVELKGK